jgi:hypothetical protein
MFKCSFLFKRPTGKYWDTGVRTFHNREHAANWSAMMQRKYQVKEVGYYPEPPSSELENIPE